MPQWRCAAVQFLHFRHSNSVSKGKLFPVKTHLGSNGKMQSEANQYTPPSDEKLASAEAANLLVRALPFSSQCLSSRES